MSRHTCHVHTSFHECHLCVTRSNFMSRIRVTFMGWLRLVSSLKNTSLMQKSPVKETIVCRRDLQKRRYSAKEMFNFKEPTNRSNPISRFPRLTCKRVMCHEPHEPNVTPNLQTSHVSRRFFAVNHWAYVNTSSLSHGSLTSRYKFGKKKKILRSVSLVMRHGACRGPLRFFFMSQLFANCTLE